MKEGTKTFIKYAAAVVLVVVSVWLAVRDVNLARLLEIIIGANYLWVLAPVPIIILSHWMRAVRWKTFLVVALKSKAASTWNLFSAVMIGYAVNGILPRGGEFVRPLVYARREKVSYSTTFATIVVERFIDLITLFIIFALAFLFFGEIVVKVLPEADPNKVILTSALVFVVILMSFYPPFFRFLLRILVKPLSKKYFEKLDGIYDRFLKGFAIIKTPSRYLKVSVESLLIWFFYTVPMYIMFFAFDFQAQYHLGFDAAIFLIIVSGVGVTIAPSPGAFGVYHILVKMALVHLYGINEEEALAYATVVHAVNYFIQMGVGGAFFMRENIKRIPKADEITDLKNEESELSAGSK